MSDDIELPDDTLRDAADEMAAGIRSFLSSLPYMAPEMIDMQARVKLAEPLAAYDEASGDTTGEDA